MLASLTAVAAAAAGQPGSRAARRICPANVIFFSAAAALLLLLVARPISLNRRFKDLEYRARFPDHRFPIVGLVSDGGEALTSRNAAPD